MNSEQAYHARGAGRQERIELMLGTLAQATTYGNNDDYVGSWYKEEARKILAMPASEPGADTGTTPPPSDTVTYERFEDPRTGEPLYRPVAERGTTPPEGLVQAARTALDEMCRTVAPRDSFTDAVDRLDAALAATQRGPVEQGRDENEAARTCAKCGKTERGWKYNRCPDCGELAPDHAREGALRGLVAKWREGKVATKLKDDMQMRGGKWIADLCADELEHALADGKEGPL